MLAAQICAVAIFIGMFILIITEKIERHWVTLGCGLLTLIVVFGLCMRDGNALLETLNVKPIFTAEFWRTTGEVAESSKGINWATILFIAGMMVMVEGMARVGFFRWLCMRLAKAVHYKVVPIFIVFMLMSFVLSMFIDSITVILFLASVTIELSRLLKFDPVAVILAEVFCSNLGGSATMCGDPPNIIIGTSLGYSFFDFFKNTGSIAAFSMIFVLLYFWLLYRKKLSSSGDVDYSKLPSPESEIKNKLDFGLNTALFLVAVVLLITHANTGLTVAFIGVSVAILSLILSGRHWLEILKKVDYKTLLFFIGLFVVVGGLEETGILELVANLIEKVSGGKPVPIVVIIIWVSAVASAFIDNIPFAATMIPVIKTLSASIPGMNLSTLAWALSMGTDIGGSATPIGASANVVGTSAAARSGHAIGWKQYLKSAVPATVIVLGISTAWIILFYL